MSIYAGDKVKRGMAIPVVLMVLSVCVVVVTAVASSGLTTLFYANQDREAKQAVYAAEAGLAQSIRHIIAGTSGWNGFTDVAYGDGSTYTVKVYKGPSNPPGGPVVPAGYAYLLATGTSRGRHSRQVGVLLTLGGPGSTAAFPYAVGSGKSIHMQGGGKIHGSMKSSEDLDMQGGISVIPQDGEGRLIAGRDMHLGNGIKWDDSHGLRSHRNMDVGGRPENRDEANNIRPNDNDDTALPFITDGRFTNTLNVGEVGEVMPNPDPGKLLGLLPDGAGGYQIDPATGLFVLDPARTDVVQYGNTNVTGLDLAGKIHFFPKGVTVGGTLVGEGTIVSGNGNNITLQVRGAKCNFLALSWPGQPKRGDIDCGTSSDLEGLILAHGKVKTRGNFHLKGSMIAYNDDIDSQGSRDVEYDGCGFQLPGLESWVVGGGPAAGPGTATGLTPGKALKIVSWQRL